MPPKDKNSSREKLLDVTFSLIYIHGYSATSIGEILKEAKVPKGSLYHHFDSKKALVMAMIKERLFPKMDLFFNYNKQEGLTVFQSLKQTFVAMSKNKNLINFGCPLYRLMVELSPVDSEFDALLLTKYEEMMQGLQNLLQVGIDSGEFTTQLNSKTFATFYITSVWGILSISPSVSSSKQFITHIKYILTLLESYKTN